MLAAACWCETVQAAARSTLQLTASPTSAVVRGTSAAMERHGTSFERPSCSATRVCASRAFRLASSRLPMQLTTSNPRQRAARMTWLTCRPSAAHVMQLRQLARQGEASTGGGGGQISRIVLHRTDRLPQFLRARVLGGGVLCPPVDRRKNTQ